jgi:hypothetical protein
MGTETVATPIGHHRHHALLPPKPVGSEEHEGQLSSLLELRQLKTAVWGII